MVLERKGRDMNERKKNERKKGNDRLKKITQQVGMGNEYDFIRFLCSVLRLARVAVELSSWM